MERNPMSVTGQVSEAVAQQAREVRILLEGFEQHQRNRDSSDHCGGTTVTIGETTIKVPPGGPA